MAKDHRGSSISFEGLTNYKRFPIRFKITLPYLFLVLVFSLGVAILASQIIMETVDERFTNQLYEAGKIASEAMVNEETRLLATVRLLSNMEGVAGALQSADAEKLREMVLGTVINHQEEAVEFLNSDLILVLSLHHKAGGQIEEYESAQGGMAYADWEIVQKVASGKADSLGNKYADAVRTDGGDYFYIASPVFDQQNRLAGIVLIGKSLKSLARQMREETLAQITIYSLSGEPLSSTFSTPARLDSTTASLILANQEQDSYRRNARRRDFQALDLNYGEIMGPWEVRGDTDLGILGVSLMKNTLITASLPSRIQIVVLITTMVFIILLIGINLATIITNPLMHLVRASKVVAGGDLDIRVPVNSKDEIADLAVSFNQMIESLHQSKKELIDSYDLTLRGWSKALELRDDETQGHSIRVTELTVELARRLGFSEEELANVRRGSILHDIGKMGVPDRILQKTGPLTNEDWEIMYQHPQFALDMLGNIGFLKAALDIPYCHHEKWDGSGYPRGLKGEEIPMTARLFTIVDVWDALTSNRPYRKQIDPATAMQMIQDGSGTQFDPDLVALFHQYYLERYAPAAEVEHQFVYEETGTFLSDN